MMSQSRLTTLIMALLTAACGASQDREIPFNTESQHGDPPGRVGPWTDPITRAGVANGSTFIEITDVLVEGDHAFLCTATKGAPIYRIDDDLDPRFVIHSGGFAGGNPSYPRCQHVERGPPGVLYITNQGDEVQDTPWVKRIEVPDLDGFEPQIGQYHYPTPATYSEEGVSFAGLAYDAKEKRVYVAARGHGVRILDEDLSLVSLVTAGLQLAMDVAMVEGRAVVADGPGGLRVLEGGAVSLAGSARHLAAQGPLVAVACGSAGIDLVDVSNPEAPQRLSHVDTWGSALRVAWADPGYIAVANWVDLMVIDATNPAAPTPYASETIFTSGPFSRVLAVDAAPGVLYAGEWEGLRTLRLETGVSSPELRLSETRMAFRDGETRALLIHNDGSATLSLAGAELDDEAAFTLGDVPAAIEPGDTAAIEVTAGAAASGGSATLTLSTDDPDEHTSAVQLVRSTSNKKGVGDAVGDFTVFTWPGGDPVQLQSIIGGRIAVLSYFATF